MGFARKRRVIGKLISDYDFEVCFFQETKKQDYSDSLVLRLWNAPSVSWFGNIAEGRKGGLLALWNQSKFEVANIEYGHGWVALFGAHKAIGFRVASCWDICSLLHQRAKTVVERVMSIEACL